MRQWFLGSGFMLDQDRRENAGLRSSAFRSYMQDVDQMRQIAKAAIAETRQEKGI